MSWIACGVAVRARQRTGPGLYIVIKSNNAISCIKKRAKVIAASRGRGRLPWSVTGIARGIMIADGISSVLRGVDHRRNRRYVRCQWQAFMRSAMFATKQLRKHALECLRLQADCMELAGIAQGHDM